MFRNIALPGALWVAACTELPFDPPELDLGDADQTPPTTESEPNDSAVDTSAVETAQTGDTGVLPSGDPVLFLASPTAAALGGADCLPIPPGIVLPVAVRQIAPMPDGRIFLVESQGGGFFDPATGDYSPVTADWSWTMSAAWDDVGGRVLVVDLGGSGFLYGIDPVTEQVSVLGNMNDYDATAIAYDPQHDLLVMAEVASNGTTPRLQRISTSGFPMGSLDLSGAVLPGAGQVDFQGLLQMRFVDGTLVVLHHPAQDWGNTQAFSVDPVTGQVSAGALCPL